MPPKEITLREDETFHPQICLAAFQPVANYWLLEQSAATRDANTWRQPSDPRLARWSITIMQVASDEAAALIAHAEQHLGAHHSPDLLHVQQETVKATIELYFDNGTTLVWETLITRRLRAISFH